MVFNAKQILYLSAIGVFTTVILSTAILNRYDWFNANISSYSSTFAQIGPFISCVDGDCGVRDQSCHISSYWYALPDCSKIKAAGGFSITGLILAFFATVGVVHSIITKATLSIRRFITAFTLLLLVLTTLCYMISLILVKKLYDSYTKISPHSYFSDSSYGPSFYLTVASFALSAASTILYIASSAYWKLNVSIAQDTTETNPTVDHTAPNNPGVTYIVVPAAAEANTSLNVSSAQQAAQPIHYYPVTSYFVQIPSHASAPAYPAPATMPANVQQQIHPTYPTLGNTPANGQQQQQHQSGFTSNEGRLSRSS